METTIINIDTATPAFELEISDNQEFIFIENPTINNVDTICGKLEVLRSEGNRHFYKVIANGCVWVYLTDCNDKMEAGVIYQCVTGNHLFVDGCHAFGCNC